MERSSGLPGVRSHLSCSLLLAVQVVILVEVFCSLVEVQRHVLVGLVWWLVRGFEARGRLGLAGRLCGDQMALLGRGLEAPAGLCRGFGSGGVRFDLRGLGYLVSGQGLG